jgi:CBS domain-containing protein
LCGSSQTIVPEEDQMYVRDGMSTVVLTVGPDHTLRQAASQMAERRVGAAVVIDPDGMGPGIVTERDVLVSVAHGEDPDKERVADHLTSDLVFAAPDWSLEQAAVAMVRGGFRHLVVVDGGEIAGILSVRDVVRVWTDDGASCDLPQSPPLAGAQAGQG